MGKELDSSATAACAPLVFGNDVDSVDVAARTAVVRVWNLDVDNSVPSSQLFPAQVRFLNSASVLANLTEHTRTLRLYPRPVVAFQYNSFLRSVQLCATLCNSVQLLCNSCRSRPRHSSFTAKLCQSQAVEFYGEWLLVPSNLAYQRIHTGLADPTVIGDKFKWCTLDIIMAASA